MRFTKIYGQDVGLGCERFLYEAFSFEEPRPMVGVLHLTRLGNQRII
jgi:hypothetical protein